MHRHPSASGSIARLGLGRRATGRFPVGRWPSKNIKSYNIRILYILLQRWDIKIRGRQTCTICRCQAPCSSECTVRGTIHVARSRNWKHGGRSMHIGEKKSEESFKAWRSQSQCLRYVLREQYTEYWSVALSSNMKEPAAFWSKISVLLNQPNATSDCKFSPDDLQTFSRIRSAKFACPRQVPTHQWSSPGSLQPYQVSDP